MKKLVLFDLDGTLLDTLEDLSAAVNHALGLRGLPLHTIDEYRSMVGHGVRNLVQQALPGDTDDALVDAALADFKTYYKEHIYVHTHPYPGIPELLADLHAQGVQLAVVSNKFQEGTEYLVHRFFPDIQFVAILGNRQGHPLKPSPEIVQEVLSLAGATPENAVLVGDSPTDIRTAVNGGIEAMAVSWGYRSTDELEAAFNQMKGPDGLTLRLVHSIPALRIELLGFYVSEPITTPPATFETPLQQLIYETFASCGIAFTRVDTDPGITMEDCAHISKKTGVQIVKTIFLCNRQQTEYYLYVTSHDKPFVTRDFCSALGIPRVSFASSERLWELTGVQVGATTILSGILPSASGVHLVMDAAIAASDWFACTDGTPTCFVKLRTRDLLEKYLSGKEVKFI